MNEEAWKGSSLTCRRHHITVHWLQLGVYSHAHDLPNQDRAMISSENGSQAWAPPLEEQEYPQDAFVAEDDEAGEDRPELDIPLRDRKLVTQPFDFIVSSIEQQIKEKSLILQDNFQRRRVWDDIKASRLIESLLMNVPIPVCYFAELEDGTYSVIDGQQRLSSIYRYLTNIFSLRGLRVRPELNRNRFSELEQGDQRLIKTRTIRCIAIQKESHPDIRFDVFERLNSGAVRLTPQELRNCTYRGNLNNLIRELCEDRAFQEVRGASGPDKRMGDAELILRFMAFYFNSRMYKGLYAPFLDDYLKRGVAMPAEDIDKHRKIFLETIEKVRLVFGDTAFRRYDEAGAPENQVNRAIYDVIMLSFSRIDRHVLEVERAHIVDALRRLSQKDAAFIDSIIQATRDRKRIRTRMDRWINALREIDITCPDISFGE